MRLWHSLVFLTHEINIYINNKPLSFDLSAHKVTLHLPLVPLLETLKLELSAVATRIYALALIR